jgi:hypothetical protein
VCDGASEGIPGETVATLLVFSGPTCFAGFYVPSKVRSPKTTSGNRACPQKLSNNHTLLSTV